MQKIVFITGSEGQIGSSLSKTFLKNGWDCYGMDITEKNTNLNLKNFISGNVTNRNCFQDFFKLAEIEKNQNIEVLLINNAGVAVFTPSEDRTYEEYIKVSDVNLFGPIIGITEFYKFFVKQNKNKPLKKSSIINIASIYGLLAPNQKIYTDTARNSSEIYGASKAGLIQLTKYFATRYAKDNLQINCIAPGGIYNSKVQGSGFIENYNNLVPQNRLCNDDELSNLICSIVESDCKYLTGQTITLDGGMSAW